MRRHAWIGVVLVCLVVIGRGFGGEPAWGESSPDCFLRRVAPAGGWDPYGGGLLHWWPVHCLPRCGGPNDYCRKPLPGVCWPPYPPYYIGGPPALCHPEGNGCRNSTCPH